MCEHKETKALQINQLANTCHPAICFDHYHRQIDMKLEISNQPDDINGGFTAW